MNPHTARSPHARRRKMMSVISAALLAATSVASAVTLAPSDRQDINIGAQPWKYTKQALVNPNDPTVYAPLPNGDDGAAVTYDDSKWLSVGLPHAANDFTTFLNQESGGGQGSLDGETSWYRTTLTNSASYAGKKVMMEFEGVHTGDRVYVNGKFVAGTGQLNQAGQPDAGATHVIGFVPHIVDLTPMLHFDGKDVVAVKVGRSGGNGFFTDPGFSGAFRFGQAEAGIFRPVKLHVTNLVHIPENVYAGQNTWGTYVGTESLSSDRSSAVVRVQTNVVNERGTPVTATLTTQIVDAAGNLVASEQQQRTLAPGKGPSDMTPVFDERFTINQPKLWYPNGSTHGTPYLYKVFHTVSVDGVVVDAKQSTLGIRVITWDKDYPYVNGYRHYTWGASGRYDYPGLGSSVPEEQQWRDLQQLAQAGGNLWRPGHSPSSPEFVEAADALGIFVVQPSGDGENGFSTACASGDIACQNKLTLKRELHRDIVIRDRSHPSILAWESNNGVMETSLAQDLRNIARSWDAINPRAAADRTPDPANGDILSCSKAGCEAGSVKEKFPNKPAWGAEYWGPGSQRHAYDYELSFALNYLHEWSYARSKGTFGMAQWYFADTPGETIEFVEGTEDATHFSVDANGNRHFVHNVRSIGSSMVDQNRFPRMLYYIYESQWMPYEVKPMVKLAHHWNRSGDIQVNAFSNCPAVRLLVNGVPQGDDQVPNPWSTMDDALFNGQNRGLDANGHMVGTADGQKTTQLPGQVHWNVTWQSGEARAQCLSAKGGTVVADDRGQPVQDVLTTAGKPDHIELQVVPELVRPDGTSFALTANGSDAAFLVARVVDAHGVTVPTADGNVRFEVTQGDSLVTYQGGTQQLVEWTGGFTLNGDGSQEPKHAYHSPGDHELKFEGGLQKIALRTRFVPGTVTVTASADGLASGSASFQIVEVPTSPVGAFGPPSIIASPVEDDVTEGFAAHFSVTASGAAPLSFTWMKNGQVIPGATAATLETAATSAADDGATYSVLVQNNEGKAQSSGAVLRVFPRSAVSITQQPQSQTVEVGQSAHLQVQATGSPKLTYQWTLNDQDIPGATTASYDTPVFTTVQGNQTYKVKVANPLGAVVSNAATLVIAAARPPVITAQPADTRASVGQDATFSVSVAGSSPFHYSWTHNGQAVGNDAPELRISSVGQADAGTYAVRITNITGDAFAVTSQPATLALAPPGPNLAREKVTYASGSENGGVTSAKAVDGKDATQDPTSRWASEQKNDAAWITVDLGAERSFNRVVIKWEAAYAAQYTIQYSDSKDSGYKDATPLIVGHGGTEDTSFDAVTARYVRMQGVKRATDYGYSLYEFEVYDAPTCCTSNDRYTVKDTNHVLDTLSGLTWERQQRGFENQGAQYVLANAQADCSAAGARLPTEAEALAIAGENFSSSAFPGNFAIWTSTPDPLRAGNNMQVSSSGDAFSAVADNAPGHALCVTGPSLAAPVITAQPTAQTAGVGRSAHFAVSATGVGPLAYHWYVHTLDANTKDVYTFLASTTDGTYATPALAAGDNGKEIVVKVASAQGLSTTSRVVVLSVNASNDGFDPPAWQQGTGNDGGNNPNPPANPSGPGTPGDGQGGTNIAVGAGATSSGNENDGYLAPKGAVDGDFGTRWGSSFKDDAWIRLDLGTARTFDHVILRWENAYSSQYTVETSNVDDDAHWVSVTDAPVTGKGGVERLDFAPRTARYVRMHSTKRGPQTATYGVSLYEFEVYAAPPPAILTQPQAASVVAGNAVSFSVSATGSGTLAYQWRRNGAAIAGATQGTYTFTATTANAGSYDVVVTDAAGRTAQSQAVTLTVQAAAAPQQPSDSSANLALHRPVLASETENTVAFKPENANDGNATGTRWSSGFSDDQWIRVDLGAVYPVDKVVLKWESAYATRYLIEYSLDGQSWQTAQAVANGVGGTETLTFPAVSARYVRMHGQQRKLSLYGYSLWEFEVYATGGTGTTPDQPANPVGNDPAQGFDYTVYPGFIGTQLRNVTNGKWRDDQVYVAVIGRDPATNVFSWVKPDGTLSALKVEDNDGSGHLTKNGQNYPNYFFTLAQAKLLKLPKMSSGRIFVSVGEPMYIKVLKAADNTVGFAGPNPLNATDPNIGVYYDWYEFTWNDDALFINTTQVDQFSIPLSLDVYGGQKTRHVNSGITQTRAQIFAAYNQEVPTEFQLSEADPIRILAPGKAAFDAGKPQAHYFDAYIDGAWTYYQSHVLEMTIGAKQFEGSVIDGVLTFRHVNWAQTHEPDEAEGMLFTVQKPTTQDVLEGKGALAHSTDPWGVEGQLEAQICAAFNRHVMEDSTQWKDPSAFYQQSPANYYSRFWHLHGVNGKAYGFAYDDVSDQSSTLIETQPEHLELGVGW
jgi:beta-galactosidase